MSATTEASPTTALAQLVATIELDTLPGHVVEVAGQCLTDFIAVAALGASVDSSDSLLATIASMSGEGSATVIGRTSGATAEHAALLNGTFAHSLDFDDTNISSALHPGAPVIAAVLAAAEHRDVEGADLLAGIIAGYEVACRIGRALGEGVYDRGFHPTAIAGTFGAAAGAARTLRLSAVATESALGVAGSMAAGSMQFLSNGSWNKRLHAGQAARNGLFATLLAHEGFRGSDHALEGSAGALVNFSADIRPDELTAGLGSDWLMVDTGFKPYPSCRLTHSATDLCLDLRDDLGRAPADDEIVTVAISSRADSIVGGPETQKIRPGSVVDAQFSVRFQCALALLDAEVTWSSYDDLTRPDVVQLAERLRVVVDPNLTIAAADLRLERAGTKVFERHREDPRGESGDPGNPVVIETKLRQASKGIWSDERLLEILRLCKAPQSLPVAHMWIPLLRAQELRHD